MRVVVVDDEPLARRGVTARLKRHSDIQVLAECATGEQAVSAIPQLVPDLVFLDVRMPDLSGFEVLQRLKRDVLPKVVFLTAYDQYAVRAFEVHAIDYLLKPIDDDRFVQALERARLQTAIATFDFENRLGRLLDRLGSERQNTYPLRFPVRTGRRIAVVQARDIDWIEATRDYVTLHVGSNRHLLRETMNGIEAQLDPAQFLRIHRSAIVQTSRIRELVTLDNREFLLRLSDGTELRASRSYSDRVERWL